jgi:hypothetical protein
MKFFIGLFLAAFLFAACNGNDKQQKENSNYEKNKESLKETEQKQPAKFLSIDGNKRKNLIGRTIVKGSITNNAKVVTFKDVEIKIKFYSKTGAPIEEDTETIYETIAPGKTVDFKTKLFTAKGTDSVSFEIVTAKYD